MSRGRATDTIADQLDPFCIDYDAVDRDIYEHLRDRVRALRDLEAHTDKFPQIREFLFECFGLFFKEEPYIRDPEEWPADAQVRGKLLQAVLNAPTFFQHTQRTTLDEFSSAVMTMRVARALLEVLKHHQGSGPVMSASLAKAIADAMRKAMDGAADDLDTMQQWGGGWGTEEGALQRLPIEEKLRLMDRLLQARGIRELSKLAGNAVAILQRKRASRIREDRSEIVGMTLGGELEHMLPSELVLLRSPQLRRLLRIRLVERTYATHEFRPRTELGRGPLIVCIDTSGSMQDGWRETWAKAVALALYTSARHDRRTFAYMHFSSFHELRKVVVRRGDPGLDQLVDIATYAFGGGTDFDRPITEALALVHEEQELRRADIVFISDGECGLSGRVAAELEEAKRVLGFSVFGVFVQQKEEDDLSAAERALPPVFRRHIPGLGELREMRNHWRRSMEAFCDRVFSVTDLTAEAMAPIFDPFIDPTTL